MAHSIHDDHSLDEHLKQLGDEELLDFWEETQYLGNLLDGASTPGAPSLDDTFQYERRILAELQLRSCVRTLRGARA